MSIICPRCGSHDTQAIHMLVDGGTTRSSGSSTHFGMTTRGTIATGASSHSSVEMTDLARRYRPSQYPTRSKVLEVPGVLLTFVAAVILLSGVFRISDLYPEQFFHRVVFAVAFLVPGLGLLYVHRLGTPAHEERVRKWRSEVEYLDNAWMCHRCGHDWAPELG